MNVSKAIHDDQERERCDDCGVGLGIADARESLGCDADVDGPAGYCRRCWTRQREADE